MLRVHPDKTNRAHDGLEKLNGLGELLRPVLKLVEVLRESLEVFVVLVSLHPCNLNFLLELAEGASLG